VLELRTLGTFDLLWPDGRRVQSIIAQPKRSAVLIYLALAPAREFQRRDVLLPLFWPEHNEKAARHALSQALYKLRQAIGAQLFETRGEDAVRLSTGALRCDAVELLEAAASSRMAEALQLYRGEFLPGMHVSEADGFERWLETTRGRLRGAAASAAWSLARDQLARGAIVEAEHTALRALELDGANEIAVSTLAQALANAGASAAAARYLETFCSQLKRDYDLAPSPEARRLASQLRTIASTNDVPPHGSGSPVPSIPTAATPAQFVAPRSESAAPRMRSVKRQIAYACILALAAIFTVTLRPFVIAPSHAASHERPMRALVVLPFQNLSNDTNEEYFVDGMHEAVIDELAHISALRVISRQSAMHYRGSSRALPEIARELDVDGVVQGSVLRAGDTVRISVQLVAANPEHHVFAASYTRTMRNILALHGEIAQEIGRKVAASITTEESARFLNRPTVNTAAYEAWMQASLYRSKRSAEDEAKCIKYAKQSAALDSTFAPTYQLLAECYSFATFVASAPPRVSFERAKEAARRAIRLDEMLAQPHIALARALAMFDWNWKGAESEYLRAIELNPGLAESHAEYGWFLSWLGRREEAIAQMRRAEQLNPVSPEVAMHTAMVLIFAGDYEQAITRARRAAEISPNYVFAFDRLHWAFDGQGAVDSALTAASTAARLAGPRDVRRRAFLAYAYARAGQREKAEQMLNELLRLSRTSYVPPTSLALIYVGLGDTRDALERLQAGYEDHDGDMVALFAWRIWQPLHGDRRFRAILNGMGFHMASKAE
jgi:TolB-like protein/DNA-binding SARP family transcriptional activator/Tfp pilus assembly protein PilF